MLCHGLAPNGPPRELNTTDVGIREIGIRWNYPEIPNGVITGFTVSTTKNLCNHFIVNI